MSLAPHHISALRAKYGDAYISHVLCIGVEEGWIVDAVRALGQRIFSTLMNALNLVEWQALLAAGPVPAFLESLLSVVNQLIDGGSQRWEALSKAFFVGVTRLWEYVAQLVGANDALQAIGQQLQSFQSMAQQYGRTIVRALRFIFQGIKAVVGRVLDLFCRAVESIADFSGSFIISLLNTSDMDVRKYVFRTVLFVFLGMQDIAECSNRVARPRAQAIMQEHVSVVADYVASIRSMLNSLTLRDFISFIPNLPLIQSLARYVQSTAAYEVLSKLLAFVHDCVRKIVVSAKDYINGFLVRCTAPLVDVIGKFAGIFDERTPLADLQDMIRGNTSLATQERLSSETRRALRESVAYATRFTNYLDEFTTRKYETSTDIFQSARITSTILTDAYFGGDDTEVEAAKMDTLCKERTGLNMAELGKQIYAYQELLMSAYERAAAEMAGSAKPAAKMERNINIQGRQPFGLFTMSRQEVERKIAELQLKIDAVRLQIAAIKESDEYRQADTASRSNLIDTLERVARTPQEAADLAAMDRLEYQRKRKTIEDQLLITEKLEQIRELEAEIAMYDQSKSGKLAWVRIASTIGFTIVLGGLFIYGISYAYALHSKRSELASRTVFSDFLKATGDDPIAHEYVKQFAIEGGLHPMENSIELNADFRQFVREKVNSLRDVDHDVVERKWAPLLIDAVASQSTPERLKRLKEDAQKDDGWMAKFYRGLLGVAPPSQGQRPAVDAGQVQHDSALSTELGGSGISKALADRIDMGTYKDGIVAYTRSAAGAQSQEEIKNRYREDTIILLKHHYAALVPVFDKTMVKLREDKEKSEGVLNLLWTSISGNIKAGGLLGASKEQTFDLSQYQEALSRGGAPYMSLLVSQALTYTNWGLLTLELLVRAVNLATMAIVYKLSFEEEKAAELGEAFKSFVGSQVMYIGVELVSGATTQFIGRWGSFLTIGRLFVQYIIGTYFMGVYRFVTAPFRFAWGRCIALSDWMGRIVGGAGGRRAQQLDRRQLQQILATGNEQAKLQAQTALALLDAIESNKLKIEAGISCSLCDASDAAWKCSHCNVAVYCSQGCAALNWHENKHLVTQ